MEKPMRLASSLNFRRSSIAFPVVLGFVCCLNGYGLAQKSEGYLMGTAIFSSESSGELKFATNVSIELERNKTVFNVRSDDLGDFTAALPPGKYCLRAVKGEDNRQFLISSNQHLCFNIRANKTLRFDILLQDPQLCDCWLAKADQKKISPENCKPREELSEKEILTIMECLLAQKGNKSPHIGVVLRNNVSQTFASSPTEVVALYYISYLFRDGQDFASAMVLLHDLDDSRPNSEVAIEKAHKAYRNWFKKAKKVGLEEMRRRHPDPLEGSGVSWY